MFFRNSTLVEKDTIINFPKATTLLNPFWPRLKIYLLQVHHQYLGFIPMLRLNTTGSILLYKAGGGAAAALLNQNDIIVVGLIWPTECSFHFFFLTTSVRLLNLCGPISYLYRW